MQHLLRSKPWNKESPPKRILFIRFHALGDVTITFPYLLGFKAQFPTVEMDLLTTHEYHDYCQSIHLFHSVIPIKYNRSVKKLVLNGMLKATKLRSKQYDAVIDLQNNWVSKLLRRTVNAPYWSAFDPHSPISAGERTANAINALGLKRITPRFYLQSNRAEAAKEKLQQAGWQAGHSLVVLNPAGFFETRNWPMDNYMAYAKLWLAHNPKTQFLVLGIDRIKSKAADLEASLGDQMINMVGQTTIAEALAIIQYADFVLSEDSGLMHMAWVSGRPTLALFGSSRSDWSRPLGEHSLCLSSADMECGECMQATCKFGDVRCLTRFSPEWVFEKSRELMNKIEN